MKHIYEFLKMVPLFIKVLFVQGWLVLNIQYMLVIRLLCTSTKFHHLHCSPLGIRQD